MPSLLKHKETEGIFMPATHERQINQTPIDLHETVPVPEDERCLTEVDHLNADRLPNGSINPWVKQEVLTNLITAAKEGAMPYAVSRVTHPYQRFENRSEYGAAGSYMYLGRTALQNAMSGYRFHRDKAAKRRVDIEVEEAVDDELNLRAGMAKVFISPRMSRADATHEVAQSEHLADEDAVRVRTAQVEGGNIVGRQIEALLVRDVPLHAWVNMLADPNNLFAKSIQVSNPSSAESVMAIHKELEIPVEQLPEGPVTIVSEVVKYIKDPYLKTKVEYQLKRYRTDQTEMDKEAISIAERWLEFDIELANSLKNESASFAIEAFIYSLQDVWEAEDLTIILAHQDKAGHFKMTRKLAVILEKTKQNFLLTAAGVVTGNEYVLEQIDPVSREQIRRNEELLKQALSHSYDPNTLLAMESGGNRLIASQGVRVGGGCAGSSDSRFKKNNGLDDETSDMSGGLGGLGDSQESRVGKIKKGKCVVETCPTRPNEVKVGGCGVCIDRCQKLYDRGKDPTKMGSNRTLKSNLGNNTVKAVVKLVTPSKEWQRGQKVKSVSDHSRKLKTAYSYN